MQISMLILTCLQPPHTHTGIRLHVPGYTSAKVGDKGTVTLLWGRPHGFLMHPGDFGFLVGISQSQKC